MNHDAKESRGIFSRRRTPSTASVSSGRLSVQSRSGSASCPTSPRHTPKLLPPTPSSSNLQSMIAPTSSTHLQRAADSADYRHHLQRSSSNYSNGSYKQRSGYYSYTSNSLIISTPPPQFPVFKSSLSSYLMNFFFTDSPSAPTSANSSRVDLTTIGRPSTGSAIYLGKSSGSSGSKLSLVSRSSSLSSPNSSPKHRARQ